MDTDDAARLIEGAVRGRAGAWADLGAGEGTFTLALAEILGPDRPIYAVDRDPRALDTLVRRAARASGRVVPVVADFTRAFDLPGIESGLAGILLANALHFVPDAGVVLARLAARVVPGGRVVIVEYTRRARSRWVPYPVPVTRLTELAEAAGLGTPVVTATRPSAYGGELYAAYADLR